MPHPSADIIPRDLRFEIERHADAGWMGGDVLHSILIDSFAVMLPVGERFFIRSLRHYEARIPDAFIKLGIQGYASQEAFHTREHESYNRGMRALGYDPDSINERLRRLLPGSGKPFQSLLITCAIEHLTYSLSCVILNNPRLMAEAIPAYRDLWTWHALEEIEHANVALAVLEEADRNLPAWKRYLGRCIAMNIVVVKFAREALRNAHAMKRVAGIRPGWKSWSRFAWLMFGKPGWFWRYALILLAYYRPGYGRGHSGDNRLIATGRARLAELLAQRQQPA
ncbi:MAG: metal-dependent hydrolase [Alphaproteobacteria bacterium]|nr:metal-dependent hydrolase [Alphaproteobacteria bacterium]